MLMNTFFSISIWVRIHCSNNSQAHLVLPLAYRQTMTTNILKITKLNK